MLHPPPPMFRQLEVLALMLPIPLYWLDMEGVILGVNDAALKAIGCKSINDILGRTAYDFYPPEIAEHIVRHDQEVIRTGKTLE